jgi:hypothetical protein
MSALPRRTDIRGRKHQVRKVPAPEKSSGHCGILPLPTRTRNPQSIEVVFVETAAKLMWYWNPTLSPVPLAPMSQTREKKVRGFVRETVDTLTANNGPN